MKTKTISLIFLLSIFLILSTIIINAEFYERYPEGTTPPTTTEAFEEDINEEQSITEKLNLQGENKATATNIKIQRDSTTNNLNKITFTGEGNSITLETKGKDNTYKHTYSNLKPVGDKPPELYIDENGKIQEASFTLSEKQTIVLGNEILKDLPKGTQVEYKDGIATITYPKNSEINLPKETIDKEPGESTFYFQYKDSNEFTLPNGDKIYTTQLGSKNRKLFFDSTEARIGDDIEIKNPNKVKTYLDFEGKPNLDLPEAYISINRKEKAMTVGMNTKGEGPSFLIKSESDFAPDLNGEKDHLAIQPYNQEGEKSYLYIKNRQTSNKITRAVSLNGIRLNTNGVSPYFDVEKGKFLVNLKGNLVEGFQGSEGYIPLQLESYKSKDNDYNNLVKVLKNDNLMIVDNNGRVGFGPDPDFISVKAATYSKKYGEKGLYKGVSQWLSYNAPPTIETFERFTGIDINDRVGIPPERIRMLMDVFASVPRGALKSVKTLNIANHWAGWAGLARPTEVNLHWSNGGVDPGTAIHEIAHVHDMRVGWDWGRSRFERQWNSVGGSNGPHTYDYGYTSREDTSTFAQMIYKDYWSSGSDRYTFGSWKQGLSQDYAYHKKIRAKLAVFYWNGFITKDQTKRVFNQAGLESDDDSLLRYYNEARNT
ncbi:hypothetical protein HOE04_00445 [archaeon]|jgi:hypothetical protein|nr:hypothetical protein [archaeon]